MVAPASLARLPYSFAREQGILLLATVDGKNSQILFRGDTDDRAPSLERAVPAPWRRTRSLCLCWLHLVPLRVVLVSCLSVGRCRSVSVGVERIVGQPLGSAQYP